MGSRANQRVNLNTDFIFDQPLPSNRKTFIRVGDEYQAELPQYIGETFVEQSAPETHLETIPWSPSSQANNRDKQEYDHWSDAEIKRFCKSLHLNNKNFNKVSTDVETKTVKQCVLFYYLWKKKCNDQYRSVLPKNKCIDKNTSELAKKKRVHTQPVIGNPHNTRGCAKRAVAAAVQKAKDRAVEQAKMECKDEQLSIHNNNDQPQNFSCNFPSATERVKEKMSCVDTSDESVITNKSETTKQVALKIQTKTVKQCAQFYNLSKKNCDDKYRSVLAEKTRLQIQPIIGNPHNTRGNVKRAVAAAEQKTKDIDVEQAKMSGADAALQLRDNFSLPTNGNCKILYATERVEEDMSCVDANGESVSIQKADTTNVVSFKSLSSKRSLQSHVTKHKKQPESSSRTRIQMKVADHTPGSPDQPRESVFPCSKCERVFGKIKSRNGHMKCHKTS